MGKVAGGHVLDENLQEFVVADAAIEPAHEERELDDDGEADRPPIGFEHFDCVHDEGTIRK